MNKYKKFTLLMAAMAITASPAFADGDIMKDSFIMPENTQATVTNVATNRYGLDFTKAAESTINSVVSIKSFATPRQQQYFGGDFMDPFEFFFGPGFGGQTPQRKQQEGFAAHGFHSYDIWHQLHYNENHRYDGTGHAGDHHSAVALCTGYLICGRRGVSKSNYGAE